MKGNYTFAKLAGIIMMALFCSEASAQLISAKTNLVMWGNLTPNLSVELVTSKKTSIEFTGMYSLNKTPMDLGLMGGQAELRYWISGRPMNRLFVGLGVTGVRYDYSGGDDYNRIGDAAGPGLALGYALPLGKHWNIEFAAGASLLWYRERKYAKSEEMGGLYNNKGSKILPTKLSVACAYVF